MARIKSRGKGRRRQNRLLVNISGHVGRTFVIKQYGKRIVISNFPDMDGIKPSPAQVAQRRRFVKAELYAKAILKDPKEKAALGRKLKGRRNVHQAAISEYLKSHPPRG